MAVNDNISLNLNSGGMDLAATLFCGQSFLWERQPDGRFFGTAGQHSLQISQEQAGSLLVMQKPDKTAFTEKEEIFWKHYFALDINYTDLLHKFSEDKTLAGCVASAPGIRVLRQDFFDTLLSFIISQNNNIPRITGIVNRLRTGFGTSLAGGQNALPSALALAKLTVEDLACLRAGFRAKYLIAAAQAVADGLVTEKKLQALPNDEARKLLCTIHGVGPKVADCVLLFALGRNSIAPMDVWMIRAMGQVFPNGMPLVAKGNEGIAQQFIFVWARENLSPPARQVVQKGKV